MICRERGISLEYEEVSSHLQNEKSVTETVIEVVHVGVKPKRVDPVAVGLTKAYLFFSKLNVCERSHPLGFLLLFNNLFKNNLIAISTTLNSPLSCPFDWFNAISMILILNLPTNIYKSSNNKKYQQKSTNLPTI